MIIIKFRENKKHRGDGKYYIYERKSFRVDGKVKKKDIYLKSIDQKQFHAEDCLIYTRRDGTLFHFEFPEELKEELYKAVERRKVKEQNKIQERLNWLSDEGFITEDNYKIYEAGIEGKLWTNKEEFYKDELFNSKVVMSNLKYFRRGCRNKEEDDIRHEAIMEEYRRIIEQKQLEQDIADKRMAIDKEQASIKEEKAKIEEMEEGLERLMKKSELCERIDKVIIMIEELEKMCK
ncbi:MAG: hypothetical protein LLF98_07215 [Clostridium sp.]|uniref:hypothetical protein n=1 Tax=Clostridium sp. TaxID=1506 RepID=UPI0025C617B6|nr:hypothetical protein [Clostridium sp.]MCE5221042.1 hypothetical protein [Clostridium sp.]